jgi:streptogramin lyase
MTAKYRHAMLGIAAAATVTLAPFAGGRAQSIQQFPLSGSSFALNYGITPGSDGALWFAFQDAGLCSIGRITTGGIVKLFPLTLHHPCPVVNLVQGSDGAIWYTEGATNGNGAFIGRITTDGTVTEFSIPPATLGPIIAGPDGALWFFTKGNTGMPGANPPVPPTPDTIGRITTGGTATLGTTRNVISYSSGQSSRSRLRGRFGRRNLVHRIG